MEKEIIQKVKKFVKTLFKNLRVLKVTLDAKVFQIT